MSTFEIKRHGKPVAKFRAPQIRQQGVNRFVWTMLDADGTTIGTIYLTTDKLITVEEVKHDSNRAAAADTKGAREIPEKAAVPGVENDDQRKDG